MYKFKKGDVVALRSAPSVHLTVCSVSEEVEYTEVQTVYLVKWYDKRSNSFINDEFIEECLVKVKEPAK